MQKEAFWLITSSAMAKHLCKGDVMVIKICFGILFADDVPIFDCIAFNVQWHVPSAGRAPDLVNLRFFFRFD